MSSGDSTVISVVHFVGVSLNFCPSRTNNVVAKTPIIIPHPRWTRDKAHHVYDVWLGKVHQLVRAHSRKQYARHGCRSVEQRLEKAVKSSILPDPILRDT